MILVAILSSVMVECGPVKRDLNFRKGFTFRTPKFMLSTTSVTPTAATAIHAYTRVYPTESTLGHIGEKNKGN